MKIRHLLLFCTPFLTITNYYTQIGINTNNPKGILHIKGSKNNVTEQNDLVIDSEGRVGIGKISTGQKLELQNSNTASVPSIKYEDGNQREGFVLVSDALGNASWQPLQVNNIVNGNFGYIANSTTINGTLSYVNTYIDLPTGISILNFTATFENRTSNNVNVQWAISTTNTTAGIIDVVYSSPSPRSADVSSGYAYNPVMGSSIINNNSGATKRYYLLARIINPNGGAITGTATYSGEGRIFAIPFGNNTL